MEELKNKVLEIVTENNGCKLMELVVDCINLKDAACLSEAVEELVKEGRLIEIEYCVPNMSYRTKSFLLPANTEITIRKGV